MSLPALAQEGGDEDTGVQVERGVPPAVREVQDLQDTPVGSHGSGWGAWGPLQPLDSPLLGAGCTPAGAGPVAGWDTCAGARPASSRWGGSAGFYRAGTETSAGKHQGHIPSQFPSSPSGSAPGGASPWPGTPVGGCFFPPSPNPSPRAQFSPSCRKSPRRSQGRASGRERQSLSLPWEGGLVLGRAPRPAPSPPAGSHPTPTCDPKAVGGAGARDAEGRGHVVLEEGTPLGEVVVPEEVEGVWGDTGG